MGDRCAVPKCRREGDLVYLGKPVCDHHWETVDKPGGTNKLRARLKLPPLEVHIVSRLKRKVTRTPVRAQAEEKPGKGDANSAEWWTK